MTKAASATSIFRESLVNRHVRIMGIININDDSFYPGSRHRGQAAVDMALRMADQGASIIDLGAEYSRPGAEYVGAQAEIDSLIPVVRGIRKSSSVSISVDTRKAATADAVLAEGADIINDISALEDDPLLAESIVEAGASVVLMHKKGQPADMQKNVNYAGDVCGEVFGYLLSRAAYAESRGIKRENIILDPGIGFGKLVAHNVSLISRLSELAVSGYPVLVGLSRKSTIGTLTGRDVGNRLAGTIAAHAWCLIHGAGILRVHDVEEAVDTVKIIRALSEGAIK